MFSLLTAQFLFIDFRFFRPRHYPLQINSENVFCSLFISLSLFAIYVFFYDLSVDKDIYLKNADFAINKKV